MTEPKRMTEALIRYYDGTVHDVNALCDLPITLEKIGRCIEDSTPYGACVRNFFVAVIKVERGWTQYKMDDCVGTIRDALLSRLEKLEAAKGPEVVDIAGGGFLRLGKDNTFDSSWSRIIDSTGITYYPERPVEDLADFLFENKCSLVRFRDSEIGTAKAILDFIATHNRAVRRKP